jgi:regulator of sigma E protease
MLNTLLMLVALGLMISIHELGHFLVAKACGVGIEKFSIGFGKPIVSFTRGETEYRIAWIPLGGYVKMVGENPDDEDDGLAKRLSFRQKAWWKKALIAFSGPFANLLFAVILFIAAFMVPQIQEDFYPVIQKAEGIWSSVLLPADSISTVNDTPIKGYYQFLSELNPSKTNSILLYRNGEQQELSIQAAEVDSLIRSLTPLVSAEIGEVFSGLPAWRGGLKAGDIVLAVDSVQVSDWYDMRNRIINSKNESVTLLVKRGEQLLSRSIALEMNIAMGKQRMIGIGQSMPVKSQIQHPPIKAIEYGAKSTAGFVVANYVGLFKLVQQPKQLQNNLGGPVMMASISQQAGKKGISYLLVVFASISLALMIMNLLPIPVLDGGHILFAFLEGIFRKPVPLHIQALLQRIGFALLLLLMLFAFYSDISKLLLRIFALRH